MTKSLFASNSSKIESLLKIKVSTSRLFWCLTLIFFSQKFLRSTIVLTSIIAILAATLLLIFNFSFASYCVFSLIAAYFSGLLDTINFDNLCETCRLNLEDIFFPDTMQIFCFSIYWLFNFKRAFAGRFWSVQFTGNLC